MISRLINARYEVLERVGEGTFFQAFKARDKVSGRIVAVKSVQSVYARDPDFTSTLRRSMTESEALTHPGIARVLEVGEEEGVLFIVTEFVRGIDLKERIRRIAPFTLSVAVDFAIAITEAVQYAHAEGIVHGDLRPHNVVVSPEGAVKVTDFGMASVLAISHQAAAANLGRAVHYQAPEVASGSPVSPATDVYSIGVMLFEMLTGGLPYPGETPLTVAMKQQTDPVPSPRALNPGVPRSLEGIAMKSLQKRPEDRYRAAGELLADLKAVRDALRFGKPLSWSPLEPDRGAGTDAPAAATAPLATPSVGAPQAEARTAPLEPAGSARMSSTAVRDDGVPPFIRYLLYVVGGVVIVAIIFATAVWMATFAKPKDQSFPNIVGKKFDDAEKLVEPLGVHLIRHDEYSERYDPDVVYRSEIEAGRLVRAARGGVNVWVSKGSRMVWVPEVTGISKEDAATKLKGAGLGLGSVDLLYSNKANYGYVISQNPKAGKRVPRDMPVNLQISEGPKEGDNPPPVDTSPHDDTTSSPPDNPDTSAGPLPGDATAPPVMQDLRINVKKDNLGRRRVRVEYDDAAGAHTPIDEDHNEGDVITQRVPIVGNHIVLRIYYNDQLRSEKSMNVGGR